jgi:hypothetical protein
MENIVTCLVGDTLLGVDIVPPFWDVTFTFSSGKKLRVFCHQYMDDPVFWSFGIMEYWYYFQAHGIFETGKDPIIPGSLIDPSLIKDSTADTAKDITDFLPPYKPLDLRILDEAKTQFGNLVGKPCCMVNNTGLCILQLDFGDIVNRATTEKEHTSYGTEFCPCGELDILVWCVWRLQDSQGAICSSDSTPERQKEGTSRLIKQTVLAVDFSPPAWDAVIHFTADLTLQVFCNYTHHTEVETNWFFRNGWELYSFNRCDDIEHTRIDWNFLGSTGTQGDRDT